MLPLSTKPSRPIIEPMLPLINVVFLLLVFFMVAGNTTAPLHKGILAPALRTETDQLQQPANVWLYLDKSGVLYLGDSIVSDQQLSTQLSQKTVTLYADKQITGALFTQTLERLANLGASNVQLISERRDD